MNNSNIFINSGIRTIAGQGLLQPKTMQTVGAAIGYLLAEEFEISCPILIATDTRPSCKPIKDGLIAGLTAFGHDVFDAGISPTPFVAKAIKDYRHEDDENGDSQDNNDDEETFFMLGIVITASHNSAEYNGIKVLTPFGYLDIEMEQEISDIFHTFSKNPNLINESLPDEAGIVLDFDLATWYQSEILQDIKEPSAQPSVLLDCANGATALLAPRIFQTYGFSTFAINNSLDGSKINQGSSNTATLLQAMKEKNAEWGCAFDGDGDRVIIAHKNGTIFDGDDIVATLLHHERYIDQTTIVGTILTNSGLQDYLQKQNKKLVRTQVGERNIIASLIQNQAFLGVESCGHITMMDHAFCSDGIFAALLFFQTVQKHPELINKQYIKHFQANEAVPLKEVKINATEIEKIVKELSTQKSCKIVVRPSNTEPVLRIMVEHKKEETAQDVLKKLKSQLLNN
jgi:phosphoglucosamine mutase